VLALSEAVARAGSSWPGVVVPEEAFAAFVLARGHRPPFPEAVHLDDLFLACACLARSPAALEHFEQAVIRKLSGALHGFSDPEEVLQRVRERLLVGPVGGAPKLAEYKGQGSLWKWAQVVAMRVALSVAKAAPKEEPIDVLLERPAPGDPPELAILKQQHSKDFAHAFTAAVAALDDRERNLLRLSIVDRVSIDALGGLYGVNRSSAARWVSAAREKLVRETRRSLAAKLGLSDSQVDSLIGAVQSQVEVSINRLLRE
jgi:RNA polymerase sigma-70 factor (ECF subfamily)